MASVLVVEDDEAILRMLRLTLRYAGYDVETATDGLEALRMVAADDPDVVLLDIRLPGMDGRQVLAEMRGSGFTKPVIVVSGNPELAPRDQVDAIVTKPFVPDRLIEKIEELIEHTRDGREPQR
jgi:CheY-like chemotaxis protein